MNVHESEKIAGILKKEGGEFCADIEKADLIVFNTCCIRDGAEKRAIGNIGALKKRKKIKKDLLIAVLGCMTQQEGFAETMKAKFPFVDIILGTNNLHLLPYYIKLKNEKNHGCTACENGDATELKGGNITCENQSAIGLKDKNTECENGDATELKGGNIACENQSAISLKDKNAECENGATIGREDKNAECKKEDTKGRKNEKNFVDIERESGGTYDVNISVDTFRTSFPNAWVNIMYGCDNFCSYCIVPYVRGREVSRPMNDVLNEIKFLLGEGYREITLLGQNVNSYRYEGCDFKRLLLEIGNIPKKFRLRFMTSNPKDFDKGVVDLIKSSENICKHIHLPAQSGSDRILKLMNRKYTAAHYLDLVNSIYENIDGALISSDIMVGFPTESDGDFSDTLKLVEKSRFSQAFTFVYSPRSGTVSAKMRDVDAEVKKRRITELIRVQNKITKEISDGFKGRILEVLIDKDGDGKFSGRTDGGRLVTFEKFGNYKIGDFADVKILDSNSSSMLGEIIKQNGINN
jgi:MiaB/RimO family radical SAM methylthiotransferase